MKKVLVLIILSALVVGSEDALKAGLRAKFGIGLDPEAGTDYFYKVPRTIPEAVASGWHQADRPSGPMPELVMYCTPDNVLCTLYDDIEDVAGLQVALDEDSFTNNVFDWEKRGFSLWNTTVDGINKTMWAIQQYLVSAESLQKSKEERLAARDPNRVLQEDAVWLTGTNGDLMKISTNESELVKQLFTKQICRPWMGTHYYLNMSSTIECNVENMYSWFLLTNNGKLIGTAFTTFGNMPVGTPDRFERADGDFVRGTIPNGSQCVYDLGDDPGTLTMHLYYTDTPWLITCDDATK